MKIELPRMLFTLLCVELSLELSKMFLKLGSLLERIILLICPEQ